MGETCDTLSEKEKETLRLMVRGHDAKSMAKELSLSVHTINERLRSARRKLDVTSSREAARLLLESEAGAPENSVYDDLRDAGQADFSDPPSITRSALNRAILIGGSLTMLTLALATALALSGQPMKDRPVGDPATAIEIAQLDKFEATALEWLALVDAGDWDASFAAAGRPFRDPNTIDTWRDASQQVRVPLGQVIERKTLTVDFVGADKSDAADRDRVLVRFSTRFDARAEVIETVTLEQEHGEWRVMGYVID